MVVQRRTQGDGSRAGFRNIAILVVSAMGKLAIEGGKPVRKEMLPYGHQWIDQADEDSVVEVLCSDWLTTGPKVAEYEKAFAEKVDADFAVAVSSGTAALHAAVFASSIGPGDEVITAPMTFAASTNCVLYQGGRPVFADVQPDTLNIDPEAVTAAITPRTKAIIAVDYTGEPADLDQLRSIASSRDLILIEDAAHALGATYRGQPVGAISDLTTFSTHPVKHITTGEGGMVTTNDRELAQEMQQFRNHGIATDHHQRAEEGSWFYEMVNLGYNYRLPDLNCALGISQLDKLDGWVARRREIAQRYNSAFEEMRILRPIAQRPDRQSAFHLYVIQLNLDELSAGRADIFAALRAENIGVHVHYIPVYWHPYYQKLGYKKGLCPVAETAYERLLSLPIFPKMSDRDVEDTIAAFFKVCKAYSK